MMLEILRSPLWPVSQEKWGHNQESHLNSWKHCRICGSDRCATGILRLCSQACFWWEHSPKHLSAEQEGVCAGANTTCYTQMTLLGKPNSATQDQRRSHLAQGSDAFNRAILASLTLMDLCLREHGSKVHSRHQELSCLCNHRTLPGAPYSLQGFKCMFAVTNQQANDLPQTRVSEKKQRQWPTLKKICEPEVMTCQYHRDSAKNVTTCHYHTEDRAKSENVRASARSRASVLNFNHIPQLSWESDQKK